MRELYFLERDRTPAKGLPPQASDLERHFAEELGRSLDATFVATASTKRATLERALFVD